MFDTCQTTPNECSSHVGPEDVALAVGAFWLLLGLVLTLMFRRAQRRKDEVCVCVHARFRACMCLFLFLCSALTTRNVALMTKHSAHNFIACVRACVVVAVQLLYVYLRCTVTPCTNPKPSSPYKSTTGAQSSCPYRFRPHLPAGSCVRVCAGMWYIACAPFGSSSLWTETNAPIDDAKKWSADRHRHRV